MPFIQLKLYGAQASEADFVALQKGLTNTIASTMGKKRELTVVSVESSVARVSCAHIELREPDWTAQVIAFVTAGTNTKEEKAGFQAAAYTLLVERFGQPSAPLYIIVQEVAGTDWGYGGLPQAVRSNASASA